jgi:hypothetical protein
MKAKDINQQWVDNLKKQPIDKQILQLLKVLNTENDVYSLRPALTQFSDLLDDIKNANKIISGEYSKIRVVSEKEIVDEVMRIRGLK